MTVADYHEPDGDYTANGPRVITSLSRAGSRPRGCRRCDSTGVVSGVDGRGIYCPACRGTAVATTTQGDRLRASWGVRR